jgi:hypothetical protein
LIPWFRNIVGRVALAGDGGMVEGGEKYGPKTVGPGFNTGVCRDQILANLE